MLSIKTAYLCYLGIHNDTYQTFRRLSLSLSLFYLVSLYFCFTPSCVFFYILINVALAGLKKVEIPKSECAQIKGAIYEEHFLGELNYSRTQSLLINASPRIPVKYQSIMRSSDTSEICLFAI